MAYDGRVLLAVALAISALPATAAAPLVLNCESSTGSSSRQFRIDFDGKSVQEIDVPPEKNPPGRAVITETSIKWKTTKVQGGERAWQVEATINRLAGDIHWELRNPDNAMQRYVLVGKCRPATQKF